MDTIKSQPNELLNEKASTPQKFSPFDFDNDFIPGVPLANEFDQIAQADLKVINKLVKAWRKIYPLGPPMAKKIGPYRNYIYARDIMLLGRCSLRTAQRLLQNTRFVLELPKNAYVRVDEFCQVNEKFREEDVQKFLQALDAADYLDK